MKEAAPPLCVWSNRPDAGTREIGLPSMSPGGRPVAWTTCPKHESQVREYHERLERDRNRFLAAFVVVLLAAPLTALVDVDVGIGVLLALVGAMLIVFPFATPHTVRSNGILASMRMLRGFGAILLAFSAVFFVLATL